MRRFVAPSPFGTYSDLHAPSLLEAPVGLFLEVHACFLPTCYLRLSYILFLLILVSRALLVESLLFLDSRLRLATFGVWGFSQCRLGAAGHHLPVLTLEVLQAWPPGLRAGSGTRCCALCPQGSRLVPRLCPGLGGPWLLLVRPFLVGVGMALWGGGWEAFAGCRGVPQSTQRGPLPLPHFGGWYL